MSALQLDSVQSNITYRKSEHYETQGFFAADFIPWNASDCPKKQDRRVVIEWGIVGVGRGLWKLHGGMATIQGEPDIYIIAWSDDGSKMLISLRTEDVDTAGFIGSVTV